MIREANPVILSGFHRSRFNAVRRRRNASTGPLLQLQDLLRCGLLVRTGTAHHLSGGFEGGKARIGAILIICQ